MDMEAAAAPTRQFDFADVLTKMAEDRASDVHLSPGFCPAIRVRGRIVPLEDYEPLTTQETRDTVYSLLNDDQRKRFESQKQLDLAYAVPGVARFRVNCFFQRGAISAAFRRIPHEIPKLDELGLPRILEELTRKPRGLVLVTGTDRAPVSRPRSRRCWTSSTRSATSTCSRSRIPIEFLHGHKRCIVNQREIGADAMTSPAH